MKKVKMILLILSPLLAFLIIWIFSLAKCEIQTLIHANEFVEEMKNHYFLEDGWRIIEYSKSKAKIYYVSSRYSNAINVSFINVNGKWIYDEYNAVWSTSGTADNVVLPYWWHCLYFFYPEKFHVPNSNTPNQTPSNSTASNSPA